MKVGHKQPSLFLSVSKGVFLASCMQLIDFVLDFAAVLALIAIRSDLNDPHGVLNNWDGDSVDPCSWAMITCSSENSVIGL